MSLQQSDVPLCGLYTLILRTDLLMTELLLTEKLTFFLANPPESWVGFFSNNHKTFQIVWMKIWSYLTKITETWPQREQSFYFHEKDKSLIP